MKLLHFWKSCTYYVTVNFLMVRAFLKEAKLLRKKYEWELRFLISMFLSFSNAFSEFDKWNSRVTSLSIAQY